MKKISFASLGINYILSNIKIENSYFKLYNIFKTEKEKPVPDNFALCETMQLRCFWGACVVLVSFNWIQTQGQALSFYILRQNMVQEELRVLWPTLLLFKTRFISTGITEGKHCLTHKLHSRHDSCILITSYFNSRTLLNPTKIWAVNMKMTQHGYVSLTV